MGNRKVELNIEEQRKLYDVAVRLYEAKGQSAVEVLGSLFDLPEKYCSACESYEPAIETRLDGEFVCLVCGSSVEDAHPEDVDEDIRRPHIFEEV